jgi:hypothetical protein
MLIKAVVERVFSTQLLGEQDMGIRTLLKRIAVDYNKILREEQNEEEPQLHKAEIKSVSRCPHNSGNSHPLQVQFCHLFLLITIKKSRDVLGRSGQPDTANVIVDLP